MPSGRTATSLVRCSSSDRNDRNIPQGRVGTLAQTDASPWIYAMSRRIDGSQWRPGTIPMINPAWFFERS